MVPIAEGIDAPFWYAGHGLRSASVRDREGKSKEEKAVWCGQPWLVCIDLRTT